MTDYLDVEDVLDIATAVLAEFGTEAKVRDLGLLQSAVARPRTHVFGVDPYPGIYDKAAALLHSLAGNHSFIDGNKRTAWHCTVVFLDINGLRQVQSNDEDAQEALALAAAQSLIDISEIANRLRALFEWSGCE
ncbi:type II toxin-antitoxin system death-on-curing family toxin [Streptacidiphilus sp. PAMC 29251]